MSYASGAVTAKSRAVFGQRLGASDYAQLAAKENVPQVCDHLKTLPRYAKTLSSVNSQAIHRGQLEALLERAAFDIFESFRVFDYTESRGYFEFLVERLEISWIVSAIGVVCAGGADKYIAALPLYLDRRTKTKLPELGRASNLSEVSAMLEGTTYIKVLREPLAGAGNSPDLGEIERLLMTDYYMRLLEMAEKKFSFAQKKEFKRAVLRSVDMENVVTLYRRARFSGADPDELKKRLIPFKYRLGDDTLDELIKEKDIERVRERLERIGYRGGENSESVEQLTEKISLKFIEKTLRMTRYASVAYFELCESLYTEIKNIRTVIEGVRYKLDGDEIMKMLVI